MDVPNVPEKWVGSYVLNHDFRQIYDEFEAGISKLPEDLRIRASELGFPVLHMACCEGDVELVTALLDQGLDPDSYPCTEDENDEPALVWLADSDLDPDALQQIAQLLIDRGACVDEGSPLGAALSAKNARYVAFLRNAGAEEPDDDVDIDEDEGGHPSSGMHPQP